MALVYVIFRAGQKPASGILDKLPLHPTPQATEHYFYHCKYQVYVKILSEILSWQIFFRSCHRKAQYIFSIRK